MNKFMASFVGLCALIFILAAVPAAAQKTQPVEYFPQTGHWVNGEFLEKWRSVPNGVQLFGFPVTEDFISGDIRVQYFQRARFEFHPENPPTRQVVVTDLGLEMWQLDQGAFKESLQPALNNPACLVYATLNFRVCYAFKDFYLANNGPEQFGNPISNVGEENGLLVQYFERGRFEWHPELSSGQRVTLTNIGQISFDLNEDRRWMMPQLTNPDNANVASSANTIPLKELRLNVFPLYATMEASGRQKIYIIVQDQMYRPVSGVKVELTVTLPSGKVIPTIATTNNAGVAVVEYETANEKPGMVEIISRATLADLKPQTNTSAYRIR